MAKAKASAEKSRKSKSSKKTTSEQPKQKPEGYVFGRPTKYRQEFCEQVVELGSQGKSFEAIAAILGINYDTLHEWRKTKPDFSDALTRAKALELLWWEDKCQSSIDTPGFSATAWKVSMACRFPFKYRESKQIDHGTTDQLADLMRELDGKTARIPFPPVSDFDGDDSD